MQGSSSTHPPTPSLTSGLRQPMLGKPIARARPKSDSLTSFLRRPSRRFCGSWARGDAWSGYELSDYVAGVCVG